MIFVGVPKEIKDYENRVALVPRSVSSLASSGIRVLVESKAGDRSGFSDDDYSAAGATVVPGADELYAQADLIVKVKEIQVEKGEHARLRPKHVVFGFNHFESSRKLMDMAVKSGATFISFEKVVDEKGQTPLLMPMSRIAGAVAGVWAGFFYNYAFRHDKSVRLKAGADLVKSRFVDSFERIIEGKMDDSLRSDLSLHDKSVVIVGGGTAGEAAARVCSSLGSKLTIVEKREARRRYFLEEARLPKSSVTSSADYDILRGASVIIGATYDKEKACKVIDEKMLKEISEVRKKVVIDVSVDQGGNFPYVSPAGKHSPEITGSILNPVLVDHFGNTFIRVPNIPSIVPRYASMALSSVLVDYVKDISLGAERPELRRATSIKSGTILDEAVAKAHA